MRLATLLLALIASSAAHAVAWVNEDCTVIAIGEPGRLYVSAPDIPLMSCELQPEVANQPIRFACADGTLVQFPYSQDSELEVFGETLRPHGGPIPCEYDPDFAPLAQ